MKVPNGARYQMFQERKIDRMPSEVRQIILLATASEPILAGLGFTVSAPWIAGRIDCRELDNEEFINVVFEYANGLHERINFVLNSFNLTDDEKFLLSFVQLIKIGKSELNKFAVAHWAEKNSRSDPYKRIHNCRES